MGRAAKAAKVAEMDSVFLRVTPSGLVPFSGHDAEAVGRYSYGAVVEATLHVPQSEKQHRLLRRIVGIVADNSEWPSGEALMVALKIRLGFFRSMSLMGGGSLMHVRSLRELGGPELNEFFERAMDVLRNEVIPGLNTRTLILEGRVAVGDLPCLPPPSSVSA